MTPEPRQPINVSEADAGPPPIREGAQEKDARLEAQSPEFSELLPHAAPGDRFLPLDPRVIKLWQVSHLIWTGVLLLFLLIGITILSLNIPGAWVFGLAVWIFFAALFAALFFWYPPRAYQAWGYRIDEKVLETRSGIWFRVITLLPLSRLQHVDLHRGPLERAYGLASLLLHTAGTQESTIVIPGLDAGEAVRLRDQLLAAGGDDAV